MQDHFTLDRQGPPHPQAHIKNVKTYSIEFFYWNYEYTKKKIHSYFYYKSSGLTEFGTTEVIENVFVSVSLVANVAAIV